MKISLLFILLVASSPVYAETIRLRFDDIPAMVRDNNKSVVAGDFLIKSNRAKTGHWERSFLPKVQASGGGEISQSAAQSSRSEPVAEVGGELNLFHSGKDFLEDKIQDARLEVSRTEYQKNYLLELSKARGVYADILFFEAVLKNTKQSLSLAYDHLALIQKQIKAGLTTDADQLEFEMFINQLKQEKLLAEEDHEHAIAGLKAVLGLSPVSDILLNDRLPDEKHLLSAIPKPNAHPEVVLLRMKEEISKFKQKQVARWWAPSVDLYGGYALYPFREREESELKNRDEVVGGVRVSMELFDGLNSRRESKSFVYQAMSYQQDAEQKTRDYEVFFEKLKHELKSRRELLRLIGQNKNLSKDYLELSKQEFERGVKSGSQLLEAVRNTLEEKNSLAATKREFVKIYAQLATLIGL